MYSRKMIITGISLLAVLAVQTSSANQTKLGNPEYSVKPASVKLWRGLVNTVTGWGELFRQPVLLTKEDGAVGIPTGIINGVFMTVIRTGAGIVDVVTFPIPLEDDLGYASLMDPDYVWQSAK